MRHSLANSARVQEEQIGQNSCDFCEICRLLEALLGLFSFQVYNFVKFVLLATRAIFASESQNFLVNQFAKIAKTICEQNFANNIDPSRYLPSFEKAKLFLIN